MAKEQLKNDIPLGSKVRHTYGFDTFVVGFNTADGQYLFVTDVPGYSEPNGGVVFNQDTLDNYQTKGYPILVDESFFGRKIRWTSRSKLELIEAAKSKSKSEGHSCIRCNNFAHMAECNLKHETQGK